MTPPGQTVELLRSRFPGEVLGVVTFRDEVTLEVGPGRIVEIGRFLRDHPDLRYNFLADLCAVDRLGLQEPGPRFAVVYHLCSIPHNRRIRLKVLVEGDPPVLSSLTGVWSTANWHEREAYDLMGVHFTGHPDLRRIFLPEDFEGHPLRKDYDIGAEPVEFAGGRRYVRHDHPTTIDRSVEEPRQDG